MTLEPAALAKLVQIIEGIHAGKPAPRVPGEVGEFLRMCQAMRLEVQQVLAREGVEMRTAGWVTGSDLGPIELSLLAELRGSVPTELWGPVEHAPALSEQLGSVVDLTLWTSARSANRVHVLAASRSPVTLRLDGRYRWFPPGRVTPGDAGVDLAAETPGWTRVRFLKATADDIAKPAHPLEYVLDYRLGPPALKVFRVIAVRKVAEGVEVLPGLHAAARSVQLSGGLAALNPIADGEYGLALAYREPWGPAWTPIDAAPATAADCLAHNLSWADFAAELRDEGRLTSADTEAVRMPLLRGGLDAPPVRESFDLIEFERRLLPAARAVVRWLRYRR